MSDNYKLVPVEPSPEMQAAGAEVVRSRFDTSLLNSLWMGNKVYRAMLAAAPDASGAITALRAEYDAVRASRDALAVALRPFANYACNLSPDESCKCHNCIARAALASAGVDTSEKGGA